MNKRSDVVVEEVVSMGLPLMVFLTILISGLHVIMCLQISLGKFFIAKTVCRA